MDINLNLQTNDIVEGKVVKILKYGAILTIPNQKQGFLHISNISNKFISNINDFVQLHEVYNVKILSIDESKNRFMLSLKDLNDTNFSNNNTNNNYSSQIPNNSHNKLNPNANNPQNNNSKSFNQFESILSSWLKDSNEKQATINKRAKRKS